MAVQQHRTHSRDRKGGAPALRFTGEQEFRCRGRTLRRRPRGGLRLAEEPCHQREVEPQGVQVGLRHSVCLERDHVARPM